MGLRGVEQREAGARARADRDVGVGAGRVRDRDHVVRDRWRAVDPAHRGDGVGERERIGDGREVGERVLAAFAEEQRALGRRIGRADVRDDGEAVELALDERERPGRLVRVLGRDEEERVRQRAGDAVDGDLALLHRLEQRGLRAGRRAVQLVDEDDVGEERARAELPLVAGEVEDGDAGELGGEEVRRALDAAEDAADGAGERLGEEGLADAGHVLDEEVAAGEQRDEGERRPARACPAGRLRPAPRTAVASAGGGLDAEVGRERFGGRRLHGCLFGPAARRPK